MRALLLLAALLALLPSLARAQCEPEPDVSDQARAAARQHYNAGIEASTAQRWAEAREAFARAYELAPLTPVVYNLATAQGQTRLLVEAAEGYRRFLRRCRSQDTPALRADAQQILAALSPRIARLTLRIANLSRGDRIELDGVELPSAVVGSAVPINPGSHDIAILRGGSAMETREIEVREGGTATVELTLPVPTGPAAGDPSGPPAGGGFDVGLFFGITGAVLVAGGVIVGIVLGVLLGGGGGSACAEECNLAPPVMLPLIEF